MTMVDSLIPISDEQAKLGQEALKTLQGLGGFLRETFGTVPQDIVALLGGNYLQVRRAENLYRTFEKAKRRLEADNVIEPDAPPSLAIPIMIAAADESRDELQDLWAALLAAAADPKRSLSFRLKFIETVKQMDPLDASVLAEGAKVRGGGVSFDESKLAELAGLLRRRTDEVAISIENLERFGLAYRLGTKGNMNGNYLRVTPLGRELLMVVTANNET
jgi:hypothetical protein